MELIQVNQVTSIYRFIINVVKLVPQLPSAKYFAKNTKSRIPQLTPEFFKSYSEQLYIDYIDEMMNISQPNVI